MDNNIKITITGPRRSGRTVLATEIARLCQSRGASVTSDDPSLYAVPIMSNDRWHGRTIEIETGGPNAVAPLDTEKPGDLRADVERSILRAVERLASGITSKDPDDNASAIRSLMNAIK